MGELLTKIKEAAESAALKAGIMERVNEDGTPVKKPKKNTPAKKPKAARKTKRKVARKPKVKKSVAEKAFRPTRIFRPIPRITPRMPRLR